MILKVSDSFSDTFFWLRLPVSSRLTLCRTNLFNIPKHSVCIPDIQQITSSSSLVNSKSHVFFFKKI